MKDCILELRQRCYCAGIATAVAGVVSAGTAAYSSFSKGSQAGAAQGGNPADLYGKRVELPDYKDKVNLPDYNYANGAADLVNQLPYLSILSKRFTNQGQARRDQLTGGTSKPVLQQAGADILGELKGSVPQDVLDRVNRLVAERSGGAFSPAGQGGQVASADFARSIGKTSTDMMELGLSHAPQWEALTDSFTYKPQDAANQALQMLRSRNDYVLGAAGIQIKRDENQYTSAVNKARAEAMPDPQAVGMRNDALTLGTAQANDNQNGIDSLLGGVKGLTGLFGGGGGSSDPYNSAGFISNAGLGTVSSGYSTPGYSPQFTNTPQGYYFSGYQ